MPLYKIYYKKITAQPDSFIEYLKMVWAYRSLIYTFAVRDLKVKYAQTILGLSWSIIQPATALIIYSFFFGYILGWKTDGLPFPVYVLSGLLGWNLFSYIVYQGSSSIQEQSSLIKKIYFPKSILPLSKVLVGFTELLLSMILLIPLALYYRVGISWHIILIPYAILFNALVALFPVFIIATIGYKRRDFFHLLPYLVTFGIWITPVFFSKEIFPIAYQNLIDYNPIANVVDIWRWTLFGYGSFKIIWLINFIGILSGCLFGMYQFNKQENEFSDFA